MYFLNMLLLQLLTFKCCDICQSGSLYIFKSYQLLTTGGKQPLGFYHINKSI